MPGYKVPTSGPVTPREIFQLLRNQGMSVIQAIGIMGNMYAESTLHPESVNPAGPQAGVGLVQWQTTDYPAAAGLVTGNPQRDVRAQIHFLFTSTSGLQQGIRGSTPEAVASNFAQYVERCASCYPGGAMNTQRMGFAKMIAQWAAAGKWATSTATTGPARPAKPTGGRPAPPRGEYTYNVTGTSAEARWIADPAYTYRVQAWHISLRADHVFNGVVSANRVALTGLKPRTLYAWRVAAINDKGQGPFSAPPNLFVTKK
jgi:Phage tail lysozyme/Fibronectin type III domain